MQAVEDLIRDGVDVGAKGLDGMTPLALASFWGYTEIVQILLKFGFVNFFAESVYH